MSNSKEEGEIHHSVNWWMNREMKGTKVRVHSQDYSYEGWVHAWDHDDRSVFLYDTNRDDGARFTAVTVHGIQSVEVLGEIDRIKEVPVSDVRPSPYDARQEDNAENVEGLSHLPQRIREIHLSGNIFTYPFPTVRPIEGGQYELMSGHRRTAAAQQAKLETIPVRVLDFDEWKAACRFVFNHFPFPRQLPDQSDDLYSESELKMSLKLLREDWSDEKLMQLPQLNGLIEKYRHEL